MYYKNDWLLFPYFLLHEIFIQKSFKKVQNYHYLHKSNQAYSYSKLEIYISYNMIYISVLPIFFMIRFLEQNLPNLLINLIFIKNNRYTLHHNDTEYITHFISHLKIYWPVNDVVTALLAGQLFFIKTPGYLWEYKCKIWQQLWKYACTI